MSHPHSQQPQLLEKHAAYESLSIHLTKLPRKLTYPGLIPIAPRLYLPGQLVRTNEILVLLGRSGEASYFAERTAWQAHQIVRRRLDHIEQGLRELLAAAEQVKEIQPHTSTPKKRVTFRDPVVCASPLLKASPRLPPSTKLPPLSPDPPNHSTEAPITNHAENLLDNTHSNPAFHNPQNDLPSEVTHRFQALESQYQSVNTIPEEYMNVLRAAELDEDSSDDDLEQDYATDDRHDFSHYVSHAPDTEPQSEPLQTSETIDKADTEAQNTSNLSSEEEPKHDNTVIDQSPLHQAQEDTEYHIRTQLQDALRDAEIQAKEDAVVNLMEFYDEGSSTPSKATFPSHFQPDSTIDFENDDEAYLDITGKTTKVDTTAPADHLKFLREEAEKEEQQERNKTIESGISDFNRREKKLEKEKKEFGSGFAKGFFSSGSSSSKGSRAVGEQRTDEFPAPHVKDPEVSELQETTPIEEIVVERKVSRKSSSRHRKLRTREIPEIMSMAGREQEIEHTEHTEMERAGLFTHIEDPQTLEDPPISKFKQLRQLKKIAADHKPDR